MPQFIRPRASRTIAAPLLFAAALAFGVTGCGTTKLQEATEQLVLSDAVDRSVSGIDFRPLSGHKVYLDASYLRSVKKETFVNAEYVTSALRQQIVAAGCLIQDAPADADIIIEARIGTLGTDDFRMTYGVPENNAIANTAAAIPNAPLLPSIPEISFARRESREAAAKVAAFAYDRTTRQAVWQSGMSQSSSTARDTWVLGAGPFRTGSVRPEATLGTTGIWGSRRKRRASEVASSYDQSLVDYKAEMLFEGGSPYSTTGIAEGELVEEVHESLEEAMGSGVKKVEELPAPANQ